jgi:hypothetical protein
VLRHVCRYVRISSEGRRLLAVTAQVGNGIVSPAPFEADAVEIHLSPIVAVFIANPTHDLGSTPEGAIRLYIVASDPVVRVNGNSVEDSPLPIVIAPARFGGGGI